MTVTPPPPCATHLCVCVSLCVGRSLVQVKALEEDVQRLQSELTGVRGELTEATKRLSEDDIQREAERLKQEVAALVRTPHRPTYRPKFRVCVCVCV